MRFSDSGTHSKCKTLWFFPVVKSGSVFAWMAWHGASSFKSMRAYFLQRQQQWNLPIVLFIWTLALRLTRARQGGMKQYAWCTEPLRMTDTLVFAYPNWNLCNFLYICIYIYKYTMLWPFQARAGWLEDHKIPMIKGRSLADQRQNLKEMCFSGRVS